MKRKIGLVAGFGALALVSTAASASSIGLTPKQPDIAVSNISITYTYNSGTKIGTMSMIGSATMLTSPGGSQSTFFTVNSASPGFGQFSLSATFSLATSVPVITTGTMKVAAYLTANTTTKTTLFNSASLTSFGYSSNVLEFLFAGNTGSLITGGKLGIIANDSGLSQAANASFFTNNFSTVQTTTADAFVASVPLPAAAPGAIAPLAALLLRRRK